jgi:hypothetical protein
MREFRTKPTGRPRQPRNPCRAANCDGQGTPGRDGYCRTHWERIRRHGDPEIVLPTGGGHGAQNANWAGDSATYGGNHRRVYRTRGKADRCEQRARSGCTSTHYQWAHIHGTDPGDPHNYMSLCVICHREYDSLMLSRGRRRSEASGKLTADIVREIRRRAACGETQKALAAEYGVDQSTVSNVICRKTWACLDPVDPEAG